MGCRYAALAFALFGPSAFGQAVSVQQPVAESFSVGTTVSVPDRRVATLGGVGRAGRTRTRLGDARNASASSMSAGVFIHDFEAMDAAVLDAANGRAPRPAFTKSRDSDPTSYAMTRRYAAIVTREARRKAGETANGLGGSTADARPTAIDDVDRMLILGEAAERRGKTGVAAIHYRIAAKRGSEEAERRLLDLSKKAEVATGPRP